MNSIDAMPSRPFASAGYAGVGRYNGGCTAPSVHGSQLADGDAVRRCLVGFAELLYTHHEQRVRRDRERILRRAGGFECGEHLVEVRLGDLRLCRCRGSTCRARTTAITKRASDVATCFLYCAYAASRYGFDSSTLPSRSRWIAGFEIQMRQQTGRQALTCLRAISSACVVVDVLLLWRPRYPSHLRATSAGRSVLCAILSVDVLVLLDRVVEDWNRFLALSRLVSSLAEFSASAAVFLWFSP